MPRRANRQTRVRLVTFSDRSKVISLGFGGSVVIEPYFPYKTVAMKAPPRSSPRVGRRRKDR